MNTLRSLVDFYVTQHNTVMPHAAFNGATPVIPTQGLLVFLDRTT